MVESRHSFDRPPIEVRYAPRDHRLLPVEVVDRAAVVERNEHVVHRQRSGFHQLILVTHGRGSHWIDFDQVQVRERTLLRIRPGQIQRFDLESAFDAHMVVWPVESHPADLAPRPWYPGSATPTHWQLDPHQFEIIESCIADLRAEQRSFDGSARRIALLQVLLRLLLLRLAVEIPESAPDESQLPRPFLEFRRVLEAQLYGRPSVASLAQQLGYSTRTLDRSCQRVAGQTAKQVLDDRVGLEVRRLLTHTTRSIASIGADFGFEDPSNFSKFVRRHLGRLPSEIRGGNHTD